MIVSITGGSGFIGSKLVRHHLDQGDMVRVLTRSPGRHEFPEAANLTLIQGDLRNENVRLDSFLEHGDILYHCAGELHDEQLMPELHVKGTQRLIAKAVNRIGHWVQLGTIASYGAQRDAIISENTPTAPLEIYGITKTQSDALVQEAAKNGAFSCTILRPSIVFGPSMKNTSLFSLIAAIDSGRFFFIGPQGASANYIHIDNVVHALTLCGKKRLAGVHVFNLSYSCTLERFVAIIAQILGRSVPRGRLPVGMAYAIADTLGRLPGFPLTRGRVAALTCRVRFSTASIGSRLGYEHPVSLRDGLAQMVAAWKSRREGA